MKIELESRSGRIITFAYGMLDIRDNYDDSERSALLDKKTAAKLAKAILKWVNES